MLLMGVRGEVGVPLHLSLGPMLDGQHAVFKRRVHAGPDLPIGAGADPITVPRVRVARLPRVDNAKGAGLVANAVHPKMEPLEVLVARVFSNAQVRAVRSDQFNDFDVAGVKMRIDVDGITSGEA